MLSVSFTYKHTLLHHPLAELHSLCAQAERLELQQKELLAVQEKCSSLLDKLSLVDAPEKKDRVTESPDLQFYRYHSASMCDPEEIILLGALAPVCC